MTRLLNESTRLVGALIEWDKSKACCQELITPGTGAFALMKQRHNLCPYGGKSVHPFPSLDALCAHNAKVASLRSTPRWRACPA